MNEWSDHQLDKEQLPPPAKKIQNLQETSYVTVRNGCFTFKIGKKARMFSLTVATPHHIGCCCKCNKTRKGHEGYTYWK